MAATEPPSVSLSFANNFWGKDDAGVGPMLDRMHAAKVTNDELKNFYAARAAIEEEYSRKLLNLSRKPLGSCETGTLRLSCDVIRAEVESMGKAHQSIAQQMKTELEEPLQAFSGGMKERRKIVQNGIEKLLKLKMQQTSTVNKARDRYEQDCLKIKGFLAQAHMVMGQEERKNKAKLEKTQINLATTSNDYEAAVKVLEETTGRWNRDWKAACDKFQDLDEERIDYTKSSLWNFANIASTVCVSDDASCEKMRLSLEDCDVEKDITGFIRDSGTGQEIPDPPKFINFCRGDAETSSQASEDENYSVAQFARTMNPAYRASSPAPSTFSSHHDPNNPLARSLGLQQDTRPVLPDEVNVPSRQSVEVSRQPVEPAEPVEQLPPPVEQLRQRVESPRQYAEPQRQRAESPRQHVEVLRQHAEPQRQQHIEPLRQHAEPLRQHMESLRQHTEPPRQHIEPPRQNIEPPRQNIEPPRQHIEPSRQRIEPLRQHTEPARQYAEPEQQRIEPLRQRTEPPHQPVVPPQPIQPPQAARAVQPDPRLVQAQQQARQHYQQSQVPLNDYPADGMTQFCRIGPPSDRSSIPSPARPASRDSQSDYSNPTSFSSIEPPSGSASPGKPMPTSPFAEPSPIEETSVAKKRGFFNSPFARRKSKHEVEPPTIAPSNRNTWAPPSRKNTEENVSPTKSYASRGTRNAVQSRAPSPSPEPVDPRANFQLNVGNNVFDVASPDKKKQQQQEAEPQEELDPIAQALEELRGVTKATSVRQTADRYHGLATPAPGTPAVGSKVPGMAPTPLANVNLNAAKRGTPPPSYEQPPMSRLGAPKPAHTSRQMQKTTQMYVNSKVNMFNGSEASRAASRSPTKQEPPRAASPAPARAVSPRPSLYTGTQGSSQNSYRPTQQQQPPPSPSGYQPAQRQAPQTSQPAQRTQPQPSQPAQRSQPPPSQPTQRPQPQPSQPAQRPPPQPSQPAQRPQPQTAQSAQRQQAAQPVPRPQQQAPRPASRQQLPQAQAPRPASRQQPAPQQASPAASYNRTASPNPYASSSAGGRPRAQTATAPPAQAYGIPVGRNSFQSTGRGSPSVRAPSPQPPQQPPQPTFAQSQSRPQSRAAPASRAASPNPAFRQSHDRPSSSRGSDMALALSTVGSERGDGSVYGGSQYGGSVRGRGNAPRPQSSYMGGSAGSEINFAGGSGSSVRAESRARSKSLAEPKNYNSQGRVILNYSRAMYSYAAQIPEELGFQKGDILAVLRLQDDGWWEAEAVGKQGRPGLVPSNYLQPC